MAYSKRFRILFGCALLISLAVLAAPSAQLYGDGQPALKQVAQSFREGAAQPAPPLELIAQLVRVSQPSSTTTGRNRLAVPFSVQSANSPVSNASSTAASATYRLKKYVSANPAFLVYKPEGWTVAPENSASALRISVADPAGTSRVEVYFADNRQSRFNSLTLLASESRKLKSHYPDLVLSEVQACKDQAVSCAVATVAYTVNQVAVKGRLFCHADGNQAAIRSYRAPASDLRAQRPLLLDILTNIHILKSQGSGGRGQSPAPLAVQLAPRRAQDGSLTLSVPPDWNFQGQGGKAIAVAPGGGAGFIFTSFEVLPPRNYGVPVAPNVILSSYSPPAHFIYKIFEKFGNHDIRVLHAEPDVQTAAQCLQQIGRRCEAADVQLSWVSPKGASCLGSFKVMNALPSIMGQWFSIVAGIWGPANDLARYLPMLEQVAASFSINDRYAKGYIEQGLAHLRQLQEQTRQSMQSLYQAIDDNQAAWERRQAIKDNTQSKWDDYRRGNSYWISDLEGGKVYETDPWGTRDTTTGDRFEGATYDYIHFEGENPRYPSENMREISSYELQHMTAGPR
jgi:hypothetical protein